jgi:hypothetical protein
MAYENGAGVVQCVHAGEVFQGEGSARHVIPEPTLFTALKNLEREDLTEILVPVVDSRINQEIIMPFYDSSNPLIVSWTGGGTYLQESSNTGDQPGINISPLALVPTGQPNAGDPVYLEVYKNGRLLQYGIDYSIPNLNGSEINGSTNVMIVLQPGVQGASHSVDNTLVDGDSLTANYLPDPDKAINLVATAQLACLNH